MADKVFQFFLMALGFGDSKSPFSQEETKYVVELVRNNGLTLLHQILGKSVAETLIDLTRFQAKTTALYYNELVEAGMLPEHAFQLTLDLKSRLSHVLKDVKSSL